MSVTHDSLPILKTVDAPSAVYSTAADVLASVAFSNIGSLRNGQPHVSTATPSINVGCAPAACVVQPQLQVGLRGHLPVDERQHSPAAWSDDNAHLDEVCARHRRADDRLAPFLREVEHGRGIR